MIEYTECASFFRYTLGIPNFTRDDYLIELEYLSEQSPVAKLDIVIDLYDRLYQDARKENLKNVWDEIR